MLDEFFTELSYAMCRDSEDPYLDAPWECKSYLESRWEDFNARKSQPEGDQSQHPDLVYLQETYPALFE